jgi:hypothetical protein
LFLSFFSAENSSNHPLKTNDKPTPCATGRMDRYAHLKAVLGEELFQKIQSSKVLVVGAGGIGCELLKNLLLSGFIDIEIVSSSSHLPPPFVVLFFFWC